MGVILVYRRERGIKKAPYLEGAFLTVNFNA
jgi:hypothetical protein